MKNFCKALLLSLTLVAPAFAQHVSVTDINYGNGNIVRETSGTGVPTDVCTGLLRYTQTDATTGQNLWQCVSGHMVHQTGSSSGGGGTNPSTAGLQYWDGTTWQLATYVQLQTTLSLDTGHNTEIYGSQAAGGTDVMGNGPAANHGVFIYRNNEYEISNNGDPLARVARLSPYATLTDGAAVAWATGGAAASNAVLTLVHTTSTRTLNVSGLASGAGGTLILKEDSTGVAGTFNLGTGCTWYVGGSAGFTTTSTLTLTSTANAVNILAFTYDGTNCYVNLR